MNDASMLSTFIENRTYDEIQIGDTAVLTRTLRPEDIQLFAIMSGDVNPAHVDPEYAQSSMFHEVIAHGMWGAALISTVLGTEFPGPGTIYIDQSLRFSRPVKVGDCVTVKLTCAKKFDHNKHMVFDCLCTNQDGLKVISGQAEILAPTEKIKRARKAMPEVTISDRDARYRRLLAKTKGIAPVLTAFAHPCDAESLRMAAGAPEPKVALLAALEMVTPKMRATTDAAALCKMADRGQITGALLDGPLGFDNAVSKVSARDQGIRSLVAGQADVLVAPDLESANMLAKQLEQLSDAISGGVAMGARVPIVLMNRSDSQENRIASCVLAQLVAQRRDWRERPRYS